MTRFLSALVAAAALLVGGLPVLAGLLHDAVVSGDIDQVKREIAEGADVNQWDFALGTPLLIAAEKGLLAVAAMLISEGADVNLKDPTSGFTALHATAFAGHIGVAEVLIEQGAEVIALGMAGSTPLHLAATFNHVDTATLLIDRGADLLAPRGTFERTPLHEAASKGSIEVLELFVARGVDVDVLDSVGFTPLHRAIYFREKEAAKKLLELGADGSGPTVLSLATGNQEMIELLRAHGVTE